MNDAALELSDTLLQIYRKNLCFLKDNFQAIYDDVEQLSSNIILGVYSPRYSLEYLEGYFDILDLEKNCFYYGVDSYRDADERANATNYSKDGSLDLLRKGHDGLSLANGSDIGVAIPIIDYLNKHVDFKNIEFLRIYKFIFIGAGLGFHIREIYKKLHPYTILIIEPDLEIFRLSLFVTDYSEFHKDHRELILSIGHSRDKRSNAIDKFYEIHNYMNYNIKHHLLFENDRHILNQSS